MQTKNAARVLPLPVGAEMRVASPARMAGQPCSWGSVGVPNLLTNHSAVTGCAQARAVGIARVSAAWGMGYCSAILFGVCSPAEMRCVYLWLASPACDPSIELCRHVSGDA